MYLLEKKHFNNYLFFIIRESKTYKILDYFLFSSENYFPAFEKYIENLLDKILKYNFENIKYNRNKMRSILEVYKIDVISDFKISFKETYVIDKVYVFLDEKMKEYRKWLEKKKTIEGIRIFFYEIYKEFCKALYQSQDKSVLEFYDFFGFCDKKELTKQVIKLYFKDEYEMAISNYLSFEHSLDETIQKCDDKILNITYFN